MSQLHEATSTLQANCLEGWKNSPGEPGGKVATIPRDRAWRRARGRAVMWRRLMGDWQRWEGPAIQERRQMQGD
ncbi:MAG TPA: hypothetical protein VGO93_06580 [Candidatus Xenobia bacterium]|jgi:hypothetical protein